MERKLKILALLKCLILAAALRANSSIDRVLFLFRLRFSLATLICVLTLPASRLPAPVAAKHMFSISSNVPEGISFCSSKGLSSRRVSSSDRLHSSLYKYAGEQRPSKLNMISSSSGRASCNFLTKCSHFLRTRTSF